MKTTALQIALAIALACALAGAPLYAQAPAGMPASPPDTLATDIPGVVAGGTRVQLVRDRFQATEGPIAMPDGSLLFTEQDAGDGALQCGPELVRRRNRPFAVHAHTACQRCIVDVWILDLRPDACVRDAALAPIGHALHVHDLLMVRAIVVHHQQHRNPVVRGRPQRARGVHQIAVVL